MSPYAILGIDESATREQIDKAYREKVKKHHPDVGGDASAFKQVQEAFEALINGTGHQTRRQRSGGNARQGQAANGATEEEHGSWRDERTPVRSSALRSVGYNHNQWVLEVEFTNGAIYQYFDVPPEVYRALMAAESHGRYFHQHVEAKGYRYQRTN